MADGTTTGRKRPRKEAAPTTPDPIEIAMEEEARDGAPDSPARRLLVEQARLVRLQIAGERAGFCLKVLMGLAGVVAATGLGLMVWQASRADGVVIEAFSTPPDLAADGLTGQVVAAQLQDRLVQLQAQTNSARAGATYANNWGRDIKVVIPQTGISVGELQRYLRNWLGHETHIGGEIFRTRTGLTLTVRADGEAGDPVAGAGAELDKLLTGGAMALYKKTQPYRWAVYQSEHGSWAEARPIVEELAASGDPVERGWAYNNLRAEAETLEAAVAYARRGLEVAPRTSILWDALSRIEESQGHLESARDYALRAVALWEAPDRGGYAEDSAKTQLHVRAWQSASWVGDYQAGLRESSLLTSNPSLAFRKAAMRSKVRNLANLHQPGLALQQLEPPLDDAAMMAEQLSSNTLSGTYVLNRFTISRQQGDWAEAYRQASSVQALFDHLPQETKAPERLRKLATPGLWSALAEAQAHVGRLDEARALADRLPTDCYGCLLARAKVAEMAGAPDEADRWFSEAVRQAPHFNSAQTEWGQALLARGRSDAAIVQFKAANKVGPRFADPIEGWGEALLAKGDIKGAAAKFAEANHFAPDWGRLHLKWGEALAKLDKAEEARAKWRAAATMDLSRVERAQVTALLQKRTSPTAELGGKPSHSNEGLATRSDGFGRTATTRLSGAPVLLPAR
jgi:hypothetical protein